MLRVPHTSHENAAVVFPPEHLDHDAKELTDRQNGLLRHPRPQAVPPTVNPSILRVGCPTPTGTLCPSLPQLA